tara:strand:- start:178 stop:438 length:261 start_codon:yes stop_codon:yes gene_type:complete
MSKINKRQQSQLPGAEVGVRVIKTKRHPKGDIESALKSLKKELKASGKMDQLKELQQFESKADIKRKQKDRARYFQQMESKELRNS